MFNKSVFIIFGILALVTMACSVSVNLPSNQFNTGETQTDEINVPYPESPTGTTDLTLTFGAGELNLQPGAGGALASGTATYNVAEFKPEITTNGNQVTISTGKQDLRGIPNFGKNYNNTWDLKLGDLPMRLDIKAGAYKGVMELGGLSLSSLNVSDGAAEVALSFSSPNKAEMDSLRYQTGASKVDLSGLANANFSDMTFKGGAGSYSLDFTGELKRDATVNVDAGLSSVTIIVPKGVSARVLVDRGLSNVDISGDWEKSGNDYTLSGQGPRITINVNLGAGNLVLRNN
jgi:N-terminal domain of toast_rack, DUF2154